MRKNWFVQLAAAVAFLGSTLSGGAQSGISSGLYQITSGKYVVCCGLAGSTTYNLPNAGQSFILLNIDPQTKLATMEFLGKDMRTVLSVMPCPGDPPIQFSFGYGFGYPNYLVFQADPGPPPYAEYWSYIVSNSADGLHINGSMGVAPGRCPDLPTRFTQTNVVAVAVMPPTISISQVSSNGALLFIQGNAGWTNVVQASSDLVSWMDISTNYMPPTLCPICPFVYVHDFESTNHLSRFYRCYEFP